MTFSTNHKTAKDKNMGRVHTYLILVTTAIILAATAITSAALLELESALIFSAAFGGLSFFIAIHLILDGGEDW